MCGANATITDTTQLSERRVSYIQLLILMLIIDYRKAPKVFAFDHSFDSIDTNQPTFASQEHVFESIGVGVVENAFSGYNACVLAYGQTGSGKSYTMMGSSNDPGLIPRLCDRIFSRIDVESNEQTNFKVEISYIEIYNEKIYDLLDPRSATKRPLKVREHAVLGPMVEGLTELAVSSFEQIHEVLNEGNKARTVASTNMNAESSRSHAVFTLRLTTRQTSDDNSLVGEKVSKISLVDLAGSERATKSKAIGKRLEEGGNINKSLTSLGMVISALAERGGTGRKEKFIPYRDSVLTWLLKDNLGGNSKTVMIATLSPSSDNFEETLSTLRYADSAKRIVNHAVVNEDPNAKIIRELREEVETLRMQINQSQERQNEAEELRERLAEAEKLVAQMNRSWDDRLRETDRLNQERRRDFAEIGISMTDGIKVQNDRFYLVNLNADPSMNELLVYYVNQRAVIGSRESTDPTERVDFLFTGIGVKPRHAELFISNEDSDAHLYVQIFAVDARVCVNGIPVEYGTEVLLRNGDRLLIGNNHFFRVHCPSDSDELTNELNSSMNSSVHVDYNRAWLEANSSVADSAQNPVKAVDAYIEKIAIKHEEEKQAALEKQYEEFERYLQRLTHSLQTPSTPMTPAFPNLLTPGAQLPPVCFPTVNPRNEKTRFLKWAQQRERLLRECLGRLKTEIVRASGLAREANLLAEELWGSRRGRAHYEVTLHIPAANLRPKKLKADNTTVCEPIVVAKRLGMAGVQLWSVEQLENKLLDMRDVYNERRLGNSAEMTESTGSSSSGVLSGDDGGDSMETPNPLIDTLFQSQVGNNQNTRFAFLNLQEKHTLIGVANVFLEVLFHDLRLDYHVPIISQQGEVCGKLQVEIYRLPDQNDNSDANTVSQTSTAFLGRTIRCRVRIKRATNLPPQLSNFVFCQYAFFGESDMLVVAPSFNETKKRPNVIANSFNFDHQQDFEITVTDEFCEYVQEDALSIEIWGHRSSGFGSDEDENVDEGLSLSASVDEQAAVTAQKHKSLQERWAEVTRRLELWIEIRELNENGEYTSVEVTNVTDIPTGGVYQLKQGLQRRLFVRLRQSTEKGGLPLSFADIQTVAVGSLNVREPTCSCDEERPLDSYQEDGLEQIRTQWNRALDDRQRYLNDQLSALQSMTTTKSAADIERESSLIRQWMLLTEERNAISIPPANSNIPGAPAEWTPPPGIEQHIPVVFLDTNADELTVGPDSLDEEQPMPSRVAGLSAVLPQERYDQMVLLPIVEKDNIEVMSAACAWDTSLHGNSALNKAATNGELVYGVVRVVIQLSYPYNTEIVLRKRICMSVYKKPSIRDRLYRRIVGGGVINGSGVHYDVVAHVPKSSLDKEDRASLALMAARHAETSKSATIDESEGTPLEAYIKSIQAVEWMLKLDRLRQESAVLSMLTRHEKAQHLSGMGAQTFRMKRTISLPNTSSMSLPPVPPRITENGISQSNENKSEGPTAHNRLMMELSSSSTSSGYASMARRPKTLNLSTAKRFPQLTSLVSPVAEISTTKLSGIDEEQLLASEESSIPARSSTVPDTLCSNADLDSVNGNCDPNSCFSRTNHLFQNDGNQNVNNNERTG
ncbi:Kinesin-73 [Aphelenchoides besseyi]|nr:Kinesin-73 [Aphelenchoides besseyi]